MDEAEDNLNDVDSSFLDSELQALQAIYVNEIEVERDDEKSTSISIHLHPATADNLHEQYVRMTLKFILGQKYPDVLPQINIRNPRGLSDEKLECIMQDLLSIADDKKGTSMLFEMIEAAKEHLTVENRPSGECAICLYGFNEKDVFTRTECYHYFHSHCLARYSKYMLENAQDLKNDTKSEAVDSELLCPMCRIPIQFEGSEENFPPPVEGTDDVFNISEEILELQLKMADLFQKQVEKGGIIDIEAEKNKYLLEISNVPTRVNTAEVSKSSDNSKISNEINNKAEDNGNGSNLSPLKDKTQHVREKSQKFDLKQNGSSNKYSEGKKSDKYDRRYNKATSNVRGAPFDKTNKKQDVDTNSLFSDHIGDHESDVKYNAVHFNKDKSVANVKASKTCDSEGTAFTSDDVGSKMISDVTTSETTSSYVDKRFNKPRNEPFRRYNRGYGQGNYHSNNSFGSYRGNRRSDATNGYSKPNFRDRYHNQQFQRYKNSEREESVQNNEQEHENASWSQANEKGDFGYRNRKENFNERDFSGAGRSVEYNNPPRSSFSSDRYSRNDNFYSQDKRGAYSKRRGNYYHENKGFSQRNYKEVLDPGECGEACFSGRYESNYNERNKRNQRRNKTNTDGEDKDYFNHSYNKSSHNYQKDKYIKKNTNGPHSKHNSLQNESKSRQYNVDCNSRSYAANVSTNSERFTSYESEETFHSVGRKKEKSNAKIYSSENVTEHEELKDVSNNKSHISEGEPETPHISNESDSFATDMSTHVLNKSQTMLPPPPGFANPLKKVIYGLQAANPPPGFHRS